MNKTTRYYAKYVAIALPGKKPGCALVIGMDQDRYGDSRDIYLLDEFEDWDCRKLVQKCFQFHEKYKPKDWIGDSGHGAIKNILYEMNEGRQESLYLTTPRIIRDAYENPYLFILPEIKRLIENKHRQLYLNDDSLVIRYMAEIMPDEMAGLILGDFPAIEALAFAVIKMREWEGWEWGYKMNPLPPEQDYNPMTYMKYGPPTRA